MILLKNFIIIIVYGKRKTLTIFVMYSKAYILVELKASDDHIAEPRALLISFVFNSPDPCSKAWISCSPRFTAKMESS